MIPNIDVNFEIIFLAAIIGMAVGALWYSPLLFGNAWMKASGMTKNDLDKSKKKGMKKIYLAVFMGTLVTSYVLAFLLKLIAVVNIVDGVKVGVLLWLGMAVPIMFGEILWGNKTKMFFLIKVFHNLVVMILMSVILSAWG
jgi:hypothetical protein